MRGKRPGGPDHDQQGAVSIGEAWASLELDLNLMEAIITSGISFNV